MHINIQEGYVPGCIGRITQLHANYYASTSGFGLDFEAKVARELAEFCPGYKPGRDGIWLVLHDGSIEGSIVIDGANAGATGAHLRWFIASDAVRGHGVGRQLLQRAVEFTRHCGYRTTYLWTFSGLDAARHLYESCGFRLTHQSPGTQWGVLVDEQRFERTEP